MTARDDYPIIAGWYEHHLAHDLESRPDYEEIGAALDEIDRLRAAYDECRADRLVYDEAWHAAIAAYSDRLRRGTSR